MAVSLAACPLAAAPLSINVSQPDNFNEQVSQLRNAAADTPDDTVHTMAQNLFSQVLVSRFVANPDLRGWDKEPQPLKITRHNVNDLFVGANERLASYKKDVPSPLIGAMKLASSMASGGSFNFQELTPDTMGDYKYMLNSAKLGVIELNEDLASLAGVIGDAIAFATGIHEGTHAYYHQAGQLSDKDVIAGEIPAFKAEYDWLKIVDPHGERICYLRASFIFAQREHPSRLGAIGLSYLNSLAELQDTKGDPRAIEQMVKARGYKDG